MVMGYKSARTYVKKTHRKCVHREYSYEIRVNNYSDWLGGHRGKGETQTSLLQDKISRAFCFTVKAEIGEEAVEPTEVKKKNLTKG